MFKIKVTCAWLSRLHLQYFFLCLFPVQKKTFLNIFLPIVLYHFYIRIARMMRLLSHHVLKSCQNSVVCLGTNRYAFYTTFGYWVILAESGPPFTLGLSKFSNLCWFESIRKNTVIGWSSWWTPSYNWNSFWGPLDFWQFLAHSNCHNLEISTTS